MFIIDDKDRESWSNVTLKFLGSVRSVNELPKTVNELDIYYVEDVDKPYIYSRKSWTELVIVDNDDIKSVQHDDILDSLTISRVIESPHKTLTSDFMYEKYIDKYIFERYDDVPDATNYTIGDLILVLSEPIIEKIHHKKHVIGYTNNMYVNGGDNWICLSANSVIGTKLIFGECKRRWTNKIKPELII